MKSFVAKTRRQRKFIGSIDTSHKPHHHHDVRHFLIKTDLNIEFNMEAVL